MKHATDTTMQALEQLLGELRMVEGLVERVPGVFYFRSKAFLHFHEDPSGLYADVKLDLKVFTRVRVTSEQEQASFLESVRGCFNFGSAGHGGPSALPI